MIHIQTSKINVGTHVSKYLLNLKFKYWYKKLVNYMYIIGNDIDNINNKIKKLNLKKIKVEINIKNNFFFV